MRGWIGGFPPGILSGMEFVGIAIRGAAGAEFSAAPGSLVLLAIVAPLVGRVFLACLPPGLPGRHAPRDAWATCAASFLLGLAWFVPVGRVLGSSASGPWILLGVPLALLVGLVALRPAGLVPRHEPVPIPWCRTGRALAVAAIAVLALPIAIRPAWSAVLDVILGAASVGLVLHALALGRVRSDVRGATALLVAVVAVPFEPATAASEGFLVLAAAGAAAGSIGWLRRGDRRALGLASAALFLMPQLGSVGIALASAIALAIVLGSAPRARVRAAGWTLAGLAGGTVTTILAGEPLWATVPGPVGYAWTDWTIAAVLALTLAAALVLQRGAAIASTNPSGAPVGREWQVLIGAIVIAIAAWALLAWIASEPLVRLLANPPRPHGAVFTLLAIASAVALSRGCERRAVLR